MKQPILVTDVARSFHSGEFRQLRTTLALLRGAAAAGRLGRHEQALLLELAEYGLFYTSFYEAISRHAHGVGMAPKIDA